MIAPRKIRFEAGKRRNENFAFRTYLKCNAEEDKLDEQFQKLHQELFRNYDCSRCRNCCKMYRGSIPKEDLEQDAGVLGLTKEELIEKYLEKSETEDGYETKHVPCDFLDQNGDCRLGSCKPQSCKTFPYTDQPERLYSLLSVLDVIEVCPVAFEIFERMKKEYGWKYQR